MKKSFFLLFIFLLCRISFAAAETNSGPPQVAQVSDSTIDKNTLRQLLHWVSVFTLYSDIDLTDKVDLKDYAEAADLASSFITNPELSVLISEFKASTFVNVYPKGLMHSEEWLYKKLNQVADAQYSTLNAPYVSLEVWFTPVDQNTGYLVTLNFKGSAEIKETISTANTKANQALSGSKFSEPRESKTKVNEAIAVGLAELKTLLGSTYAPNIALLYNEEMYLNRNTIEAWQSTGKTIELKAVDKNGNLLTESVIWTNATGIGSIATYPLDAVGTNSVTLRAGSNQISVNVKVKEFTLDVNELLKRLIVEALTAKKKRATDDLVVLREDSVNNTTSLRDAIARLEKDNFPLENTGTTLTPLFSEPILTDSATALTSNEKVESFNHLRKRKKLLNTIKQNLNVSAFADLVVDNPDRLNELVDELLRSSGELIANLILGKDSKGQEDAARDIVVDYINQTLEELGGDYTDYSTEEVLPVEPPAVTSSTPTFKADQYVYINPNVNFPDKDAFLKQLQDSLKVMQPPLYVFINYSQDVSTGTYLQRSQYGRPVGLPADARYKVFTVVNIPGSVKEQLFVEGTQQMQAGTQSSNSKEKIWEVVNAVEDQKLLKGIAISFFDANSIDISGITEEEILAFGEFLESVDCPDPNDPDCVEELLSQSIFGGLFDGLSYAKRSAALMLIRVSQKIQAKLDNLKSCDLKGRIDDETTFNEGFLLGLIDWGCSHKDLVDPKTYQALYDLFFYEPDLYNQLVAGFKNSVVQLKNDVQTNDGLLGYHTAQTIVAVVEVVELVTLVKNIPKTAGKIGKFTDGVKGLAKGVGKSLTSKTSWLPNRTIVGNLDNPKGLIGVYDKTLPNGTVISDTKRMIQELDYPQTFASTFETSSKDGFKILNTNRWYYQDGAQYWDDFNRPWLDELISKKADVVVLSDKGNELLKYQLLDNGQFKYVDNKRVLTGFGKEIEYMDNLVQQGKYQWEGANGTYKHVGN